MRKNFILDTNVLLHDPNAIYGFEDNTVIITIDVIEDLDHFKKDMSDLGANARKVSLELDALRKLGNLGEGVRLKNGGLFRLYLNSYREELEDCGLNFKKNSAHSLLALAVYLHRTKPDVPSILVTKSSNLRLKADALGIYAEDFEASLHVEDDSFFGHCEHHTDAASLQELTSKGRIQVDLNDFDELAMNEYVLLKDKEDNLLPELTCHRGNGTLEHVYHYGEGIMGIEPRNVEQCFALNALLDPDIKLVTLQGKAGTGKTLIAVAAGLQQVLKEGSYHKVLISRPTVAMGRDIGFIPGDIEEKLRPWMQPIYDALELLLEIDRKTRARQIPADILEAGEVQIEALSYIRGRSIPNQYLIIDEAQNLTPLEVKTIVTRCSMGTKIIFTGDPEQIDNPYMDRYSNGFADLIHKFKGSRLAAHVRLTQGERSELAEEAANLL
ncbi:MAG: PhoH family protein [Lentisphaeria bacterium]|nr:PhoH family protein [Lentisphaeria bacterium]